MIAVLDSSQIRGTQRLAAICLANHADDEGRNCFPSMARIARQMACSVSQARRQVHALIEAGYVDVEPGTEQGGNGSRRYRLRLDRLTPSKDATPSRNARGTPSKDASPPLAEMRVDPLQICEPNSHRTVNRTVKKNGHAFTPEFEGAFLLFPKRSGDNPKGHAFTQWRLRLAAGRTVEEMTEGVRRYRAYCDAKGDTGTQYVMQAKRFFGPEEPFRNAWGLPAAKGKRAVDADFEGKRYAEEVPS